MKCARLGGHHEVVALVTRRITSDRAASRTHARERLGEDQKRAWHTGCVKLAWWVMPGLAACGRLGFDPISSDAGTCALRSQALAAGEDFACLVSAAMVLCFGNNESGQLGDGTRSSRAIAAPVRGPSGATQVSAHEDQACAVAGGAVWCWGANFEGQLGRGGNAAQYDNVPQKVVFP